MTPEIISIVGKSNSGKTTLMVKLIAELSQRGLRIGSVKHAHDGFEFDKKGKDSYRHKAAGAAATLVLSTHRAALVKDDDRSDIERMKIYHAEADLILAEGFKSQDLPKIEIFRKDGPYDTPLFLDDPRLIALVTDTDLRPAHAPALGLDDVQALAQLVQDRMATP